MAPCPSPSCTWASCRAVSRATAVCFIGRSWEAEFHATNWENPVAFASCCRFSLQCFNSAVTYVILNWSCRSGIESHSWRHGQGAKPGARSWKRRKGCLGSRHLVTQPRSHSLSSPALSILPTNTFHNLKPAITISIDSVDDLISSTSDILFYHERVFRFVVATFISISVSSAC